MIRIIDSHCHLYYEPYISNLDNVIKECKDKNIFLMLSIGVDYETSLKNIEISKKFSEVYCTVGLHPNNVRDKKKDLEKIFTLIDRKNKVIGIGECGIDLFKSSENLKDQIYYFEKQIEKSIDKDLPLIIHSRNSDNEVLDVLNGYKNKNLNFIIHCFSSDYNFAKKIIDIGGYISFGGMLTFKNNDLLKKSCLHIPIEKILVETDSPYLTPHPFRGKLNHPKNTDLVLKELAKIKNISINEASSITTENFLKLFAI